MLGALGPVHACLDDAAPVSEAHGVVPHLASLLALAYNFGRGGTNLGHHSLLAHVEF